MAITIGTPGIGGNVDITLAELKSQKSTHQPLTEEISDLADSKSDITLDVTLKPSEIPRENLDSSHVVQEDQVEEVAEDASSESDSDLDPTLEQPTMSERRRIQNLMFNSLLVIRDLEPGYQILIHVLLGLLNEQKMSRRTKLKWPFNQLQMKSCLFEV